jgi:acyl-CoA dehydrogenase
MTHGIFLTDDRSEGLGKLEYALSAITHAEPVYKKLYKATKAGELKRAPVLHQLEPALEKQMITPEEADRIRLAEAARYDAVTVDEFTLEEYNRNAIRDEEIPGAESEKIAEAVF